MKTNLILICLMLLISGCTQTIVEKTQDKTRFKINTFLMTSGLESLYYDPDGIFEVGKYKGIPSDITLKYNPITKSFEVVTEANNLSQ